MLLSVDFIWFWVNLRNFNPRKIPFLKSFRCKPIFPQSLSMTAYIQSDVKFYGGSNGAYHVFVRRCAKKFLHEKPRKSWKNHEYSWIFEKFLAFFCMSWRVLSYKWVKNKISKRRKIFEKSSEFSLNIRDVFTNLSEVTSLTYIGVFIIIPKIFQHFFFANINTASMNHRPWFYKCQ